MKSTFVKAIARYQNLYSKIDTRNRLIEKAFGDDTSIFDFTGLDEVFETIFDMLCLMFPLADEVSLRQDLEWFIYECPELDEKNRYVEYENKKWSVKNSDEYFDYLNGVYA